MTNRIISVLAVAALVVAVACGETPTGPAQFEAGPAFDDIPNTLDSSVDADAEVMSLVLGGANGTTNLYVGPTNGDGKNGCNLTGSTTLVVNVNSSDASVATVSPSQITFGSCGDTPVLTVTAVGVGSATISLSLVSNSTAGTFNLSPATFTVNVTPPPSPADVTPPTISYVLSPASPNGQNDWYTGDVTLTWTVTENESAASLVKTGCVDQNITSDQSATTYSCSATSDGGSAGPVEVTIQRDATAPAVAFVGGPADGGSYYFGSVPAAPTCSASDALSGIDGSCTVSGYGMTVGTHTVTTSATDMAGNTSSVSRTYTVLAWTLDGFFAPVNMSVVNGAKSGSTVPLKFRIFAGAYGENEQTDPTAAVKTFRVQPVTCGGAVEGVEEDIDQYSTGGTVLRYDFDGGQFIQNWQTPKNSAGKCYRVTMTAMDGSTLEANFRLK